MKIILACSAQFYLKIPEIKSKLESMGFVVLTPNMANLEEEKNLEEAQAKIKFNVLKEYFKKVEQSDAMLILNYEKKGIKGYIGGNSFLEMGKAYDFGIPVYLIEEIPKMDYTDEIKAMQPIVINGDLKKINPAFSKK